MTDFKKLFKESNTAPRQILYNGKSIFAGSRFPVKNGDILTCSIESTKSSYPQGFGIQVDGYFKFLGEISKKGKYTHYRFWEDAEGYDHKDFKVRVFTKKDHVFIRNIWETKDESGEVNVIYIGQRNYIASDRWNGAAMYSEDIPEGKRYFCNDGDLDDDFDDIIFTVQKAENTQN